MLQGRDGLGNYFWKYNIFDVLRPPEMGQRAKFLWYAWKTNFKYVNVFLRISEFYPFTSSLTTNIDDQS